MDSSAKMPTSISSYIISDFGDYDGCLGIDVNSVDSQFSGRYCLSRIHVPLPRNLKFNPSDLDGANLADTYMKFLAKYHSTLNYETFHFAVCIPSTCEKVDLENILTKRKFDL